MVDDKITDGRRIAQLLSSELTGRTDGVLAAVSVVDADPDAVPTMDGTFAFAVERELNGESERNGQSERNSESECESERVATVEITPNTAILNVSVAEVPTAPAVALPDRRDLRWVDGESGRLAIERGAAVKPATDLLCGLLDEDA